MRNQKVLIAIPVYQYCQTETMQSVYELKIPFGIEIKLVFVKGYTVAAARNVLVDYSLKNGFDYTFFVDGDIILPPDALNKLLYSNAPIATGWYIKKIPGQYIPELYRKKEDGQYKNFRSLPENELLPVAACGFGCTLVKNGVFQKIGSNNWFEYVHGKNAICSEDINFCIKASEKGFAIIADTSLCCGHVGQIVFQPPEKAG